MSLHNNFVSPEVVAASMPQVAKRGGIQSCFLTSQLNGLVVNGRVSAEEAAYVQERATTDPSFEGYWQRRNGNRDVVWSKYPAHTTHIIGELVGREVSLEIASAESLEETLRSGRSVVTNDGPHARLAVPCGEESVAVFDPLHPENANTYSVTEAGLYFQHPSRSIVVI